MTPPTSSQSPVADEPVTAANAPVSFGVFSPNGKVVLGLKSRDLADELARVLRDSGWPEDQVVDFMPPGTQGDLAKMAESASAVADFGYERTLLNRYRDMAQRGYHWLLVTVDNLDHATRLAGIAKHHGAEMAVYYRRFVIEDLI